MSNYTKSTNFAAKDSLPSGNANKVVKGTEINTEFDNIATAITSKADLNSPTLVTPNLGTPSVAVLTNATGLPLTTGVTGTLLVANGGTGTNTFSAGALLKGAGTSAITTATAGTDYAAATTGTSAQLLANNGSGGFSNVTVGSGLSLSAGTLSNTTSVSAATPTTLGAVYGSMTTAGASPYLTALGYNAGANTTGTYNTAVGYQALLSNTNASYNTAVGTQALYVANRTADGNAYNVSIGYQAGYSLTTGQFSTFVGAQAGYSTTGSNNTFVGPFSGYYVTSGASNTILGRYGGNQDGLDIRSSSNYVVLSDGDGNRQASMAEGKSLALDSAVPQSGTGITFPATQSASSDANTLDDYEEGTWTPVSSFSGGNGTRVDTVTGNKYTKIGDIVYAFFDIAVTKGTASGDLSITGLPFARGGSANRGGGVFFTYVSIQALTNGIYGYIGDNSTSFTVFNSYNLANVNTTTNLTGNFQLIGTAIYKV